MDEMTWSACQDVVVDEVVSQAVFESRRAMGGPWTSHLDEGGHMEDPSLVEGEEVAFGK